MNDQQREFHAALYRNDATAVTILLSKQEIDINAGDELGITPLHIAATECDAGLFDTIISKGADIHSKSLDGTTPLHAAAFSGNLHAVKKLIRMGVDINAVDNYGETPMHDAAFSGSKEIEKLLIIWGARVGVKNQSGQTALDLAQDHRDIPPHMRVVQKGEAA